MNITIKAKSFTASIRKESPRAQMWEYVFGGLTVPITTPVPIKADLPGKPNVSIFMLDIGKLNDSEKERLAEVLSKNFSIPIEEMREEIPKQGVPILSDDVIVSVYLDTKGD